MDENITLRNAASGDIDQIKTILFSTLNEYAIAIPDNYSVADINSIGDINRGEKVFVLVRNDIVIGFILLIPIYEDCIELKRLYITPSERGKRLGEYLLNQAIKFAKEKNLKYIRLETTSKFKEAVSLYKKHGFSELNEVEKAPGHDLAFEKCLK
jgi:GNAT superfamily N-acetyltransferase